MGTIINNRNKVTGTLLDTKRWIGPHVNVDKPKDMLMLHDQSAGQDCNIKIVNELFEYIQVLGMALTDQNYLHGEVKSILNSGNSCYHSSQNILSSCLLSKNMKTKM